MCQQSSIIFYSSHIISCSNILFIVFITKQCGVQVGGTDDFTICTCDIISMNY